MYTPYQLYELHALFVALDADRDGVIDFAGVTTALYMSGRVVSEFCLQFWLQFDACVTFEHFVNLVSAIDYKREVHDMLHRDVEMIASASDECMV